jgi:acyl-CoA thioester hydrolase
LGNSSWRYDLGLFRNEIGTAFAEGFFAQVQVDAKSGRPTPVSPDMRAALEQLR